MFLRAVEGRKGLRLNSLCTVDEHEDTLARSQTLFHLVAEVDMSRSVDQIEQIILVILGVANEHTRGLRFYCDSAFSLHLQIVKELRRSVIWNVASPLHDGIGQCALSVIDVGNDTEGPAVLNRNVQIVIHDGLCVGTVFPRKSSPYSFLCTIYPENRATNGRRRGMAVRTH